MVDYKFEQSLSLILKAVSDSTRRSLLTLLVQQGAMRVTDLADHYEMSLNAVSKHIKVLEKNGLITRKTTGRTHWIAANIDTVYDIERWLAELKSIGEFRLDKLESIMKKDTKDE